MRKSVPRESMSMRWSTMAPRSQYRKLAEGRGCCFDIRKARGEDAKVIAVSCGRRAPRWAAAPGRPDCRGVFVDLQKLAVSIFGCKSHRAT